MGIRIEVTLFHEATTDEATPQLAESLVHFRFSLKSNTQTAKPIQPCDSSPDDPSGLAQTTAMSLASVDNLSVNTASFEQCGQAHGIVGSVNLNYGGLHRGCYARRNWPEPLWAGAPSASHCDGWP